MCARDFESVLVAPFWIFFFSISRCFALSFEGLEVPRCGDDFHMDLLGYTHCVLVSH